MSQFSRLCQLKKISNSKLKRHKIVKFNNRIKVISISNNSNNRFCNRNNRFSSCSKILDSIRRQWKLVLVWISNNCNNSNYRCCSKANRRLVMELNFWTKIKWLKRNKWTLISSSNIKCKIKEAMAMVMHKIKLKITNKRLTINLSCSRSYKVPEWEITSKALINSGTRKQIWSRKPLCYSLRPVKILRKMCLIANFWKLNCEQLKLHKIVCN